MSLRFHVLGPVELRRDGAALPLGATKQRTLLVGLLMHANAVVTTDTLCEMLWDQSPPASAIQNLRTYVAALRRLTRGYGNRLYARGDGYLLRVEPGELDLDDVARATELGREAIMSGDVRLGRAHLARAVGHRRGPAGQGVIRTAAMSALLDGVEEQLLTVVEELLDARLEIGEHRDVITELRRRVAEHPLRERFHAQLMLALYRSGRQTEALEAYQRIRARLVADLGVEPGGDLQAVHKRILTGADAAPPVPHGVGLRPAQLPPAAADFTGRTDLRAALRTHLAPDDIGSWPRIATVCGVGGSGKTALAVRVAHDIGGLFPDGHLFLELGGMTDHPVDPGDALARLLRGLGVDGAALPAGTSERAALYRSVLTPRNVLIVLDDARDAAQIRPLLPGAAGCSVLITTRTAIACLDGTMQIRLDALEGSERERLFWRIVGTDRQLGAPDAADRVIDACGGLPLAIRIAASRLAVRRHWTVEDLASRLADSRRRLDELTVDDLSVRASFELSFRALTPLQARVFTWFSACDARDLPAEALAALADIDEYDAAIVADRLVDLNLLVSRLPGRYRLHDLLRLYAREKLAATTRPDVRDAGLRRLCRAYAEMLRDATLLTRPGNVGADTAVGRFGSVDAAWTWLEAEYRTVVTLIEQCANDGGDVGPIAELLHRAQGFLRSRGHWASWDRAAGAVLAAAIRTGDRRSELTARQGLGHLASLYGRFRDSARHLQSALELARQLDDAAQQAAVLNRIGMLEYAYGDYANAVRRHVLAYEICLELGDLHGMCANLTNIGQCRLVLDQPTEGLEALNRALALAHELADEDMVTMVIHHMARCQVALGRFDVAIAAQRHCVRATRARGMREGEAFSMAELGRALLASDRPGRAVASLEKAVDLFRELPSPVGVADMLVPLIEALRRDGQTGRADVLAEELAVIRTELDASAPEISALRAL
jgi:DNA-binding SARP family transcriptional activator/tetratricopeptide (TPR) repeat protein